jgi:hypothetical protein
MTFFIKLEEGNPVGHAIVEQNFRQLFPDTSFPRFYTAEVVEPFGYGIYDFSNMPQATGYTKYIEVAPVKNESGVWIQTWQLVDMTDEEKQEHDLKIANQVRVERNTRLFQTDYMALTDSTLTAEMAAYRQALRDVPTQDGFPHNVVWPTKPE